MTIADVINALEAIAPERFAFSFDKVGLQIGDPKATVSRAVVSLDRSLGGVAKCREIGAELLLAHHPLIFEPLDTVTSGTHVGRTVRELIKGDINFIAAHTNWDSARGGVNDALACKLGLEEVSDFGGAARVDRLKVVVFVPTSDLESILDAASAAGAGEIGFYSRCAFYSAGTGTYIGGEGSSPSIGEVGRAEQAEEVRVEMVLRADQRAAVESAIRGVHSYEEPAIDFVVMPAAAEQPAGRIGVIRPISLREFAKSVGISLGSEVTAWGDPDRTIQSVAVVGGAADGEWWAAKAAGADVFVTGEVRQHNALEASESGFAILAAGHYATEQPGVVALKEQMAGMLPTIEWSVFEPAPGFSGRPF